MGPETVESSYSMEKEPFCRVLVDDSEAVYFFFKEQAEEVHELDVTQRSEDPAIIVKV